MSGLTIPGTIDDVTPEWLTGALREAGVLTGRARVSTSHPAQVGLGVGIMGVIHRIALTYQGDAAGAPGTGILARSRKFSQYHHRSTPSNFRPSGVNSAVFE